jgi:hypothetical protein
VNGGGPHIIDVTGAPSSPVELSLIAGGSIIGRIVDAAGQPLKGIQTPPAPASSEIFIFFPTIDRPEPMVMVLRSYPITGHRA